MKTCLNPLCNKLTNNPTYCCLSCSTSHRGQIQRHNKELSYNLNPKLCKQCNNKIEYNKRNLNKFCSQSCGAIYSNNTKDWSKIRTGPIPKIKSPKIKLPRGRKKKIKPVNKIKSCIICSTSFTMKYDSNGRTCSKLCHSKFLSNNAKERIYNGFNPNNNRGRGKKSYMEDSFEKWLLENNITNFKTEEPFKHLNTIKTYFVDFYFPDKNLIIELDGTQHKYTVEKDKERDDYISSTYGMKIIRISHKEYTKQLRIHEIKNILGIN